MCACLEKKITHIPLHHTWNFRSPHLMTPRRSCWAFHCLYTEVSKTILRTVERRQKHRGRVNFHLRGAFFCISSQQRMPLCKLCILFSPLQRILKPIQRNTRYKIYSSTIKFDSSYMLVHNPAGKKHCKPACACLLVFVGFQAQSDSSYGLFSKGLKTFSDGI